MTTVTLTIKLQQDVYDQLADLLANGDGFAMRDLPTMHDLVRNVLESWADGWRRPGSWERLMLVSSGHAATGG
jgi:hypothetical protein